MKKGSVYTCNGCLALEEHQRCVFPMSTTAYNNRAYCGIGYDIVTKFGEEVTSEYLGECKPKLQVCKKPKTIDQLIKAKTEFFDSCHLK